MPSALARIQLRQGIAADWTTANPVLAVGEPGVEIDTLKVKVGDGVRSWNVLPYVGSVSSLDATAVTGLSSFIDARIPVKDVVAGSNVTISKSNGTYTIAATGGGSGPSTVDAANVTGLTTFIAANSPVKGLTAGSNITLQNNNGNYTIAATGGGTGPTTVDAASVTGLPAFIVANSPVKGLTAGSNITLQNNNGTYTIAATGTVSGTVNASDVVGLSTAVSALVPIKDIKAGTNIKVQNDNGTVTVTATGAAAAGVTTLNSLSADLTVAGTDGLTVDSTTTPQTLSIGVSTGGTWTGGPNAPAAPTNVTATADDSAATVHWSPPAGVSSSATYDVQYSSDAGTTWKTFQNTDQATIQVTGLVNGTQYVFRVRTVLASTSSGWSAPSSPVTPASTGDIPDDISLSANSIVAGNAASATIGTLAAFSSGTQLVASFSVTGGANAADFTVQGTDLKAARALAVSGGATRTVQITARSAGGTFAKTFTITVVAASSAPAAVTGLSASSGGVDSSGATLSLVWTAPADNGSPITGYSVQYKTSAEQTWTDATYTGTDAHFALTGLAAGTGYSVQVAAINAIGTGPYASVTATTAQAVITFTTQPTDATADNGSASFTAAASVSGSGAVSYQWQKKQADGTWSNVAGATADTLTLTALTVADTGTVYRVQASSTGATSVASDSAVLTVKSTALWYRTDGSGSEAVSDGTKALALVNGGLTAQSIYTTDGAVFSAPSAIPDVSDPAVLAAGGPKGFVALAYATTTNPYPWRPGASGGAAATLSGTSLAWSADGDTWSQSGATFWRAGKLANCIAGCSAGFYAWQGNPVITPQAGVVQTDTAYRSADGLNWTTAPLPAADYPNSMTPGRMDTRYLQVFPYGSMLVAISLDTTVSFATARIKLSVSSNGGATWTVRTGPPKPASSFWVASAVCGNKMFLFSSGSQYAVTSDFVNWSLKSMPFTDNFRVAAAAPDGSKIAVIGDRQQAAVCLDPAAETWTTETLPIPGSAIHSVAATASHFVGFSSAGSAVRALASVAGGGGNNGGGGTPPSPPAAANPTAAFRLNAAQWRHTEPSTPACAAAFIKAPKVSYNACRVSWPADSISYSRYTVEWRLPKQTTYEALTAHGQDAGFTPATAGCTYVGTVYKPFSYQAVSSTELDIYLFDKLLPAGASARQFAVIPATAAGLAAFAAAGFSGYGGTTLAVNAGHAYVLQDYCHFKVTWYLTTGGTHVEEFTLPTVLIDPTPSAPPPAPITPPSAPAAVTVGSWGTQKTSQVCFHTVPVTWTAPSETPKSVKVEYFVPSQNKWFEFPVSQPSCEAGFHLSGGSHCVVTKGWSAYRLNGTTGLTIYRYMRDVVGPTVCNYPPPTGLSRRFRVSFANAGGYGPATEFTVTT